MKTFALFTLLMGALMLVHPDATFAQNRGGGGNRSGGNRGAGDNRSPVSAGAEDNRSRPRARRRADRVSRANEVSQTAAFPAYDVALVIAAGYILDIMAPRIVPITVTAATIRAIPTTAPTATRTAITTSGVAGTRTRAVRTIPTITGIDSGIPTGR